MVFSVSLIMSFSGISGEEKEDHVGEQRNILWDARWNTGEPWPAILLSTKSVLTCLNPQHSRQISMWQNKWSRVKMRDSTRSQYNAVLSEMRR